jgi:hypothetical protein
MESFIMFRFHHSGNAARFSRARNLRIKNKAENAIAFPGVGDNDVFGMGWS